MKKEVIMKRCKEILRFMPDILYIKFYFRLRVKRKLDLKNPTYFNDKLQWMKFNYRFPLQSIVSDKYLVRAYVEEKIGEKYLIPLYGVWKNFDEINFEDLPNQFVLKCNHDSGGLVICYDKNKLVWSKTKKTIEKCLKDNFFFIGREYQYKNIIPKILCEKFISDDGTVPVDYKIYCFNGTPDSILVCKNRFKNNSHRAQYFFYDLEWNFLRYNKGDENIESPNIDKPENLEEMIEIAKELSKDFVFARIDLYNIKR